MIGTANDKKKELDELCEKVDEYSHEEKKRLAWKTPIASMLLLVSCIFAFWLGFTAIVPGITLLGTSGLPIVVVGAIRVFLGFSALVSGVLCLLKRKFMAAFALSIPSIFILVFPGIIAMILIVFSDDEFVS